ncbi:hypothetical protein QZH41_000823 [Actinostola sp. cb2023]|nr:hypothetical protein QZH41_000823 [Actinostola sp. cb2023]
MVKKMGKKKKKIITVNENKITREPVTRRIVNREQKKTYQVVYDKRILINQGADTMPYGYTWEPRDDYNDSVAIDRDEVINSSHCLNDLKIYSEHYTPSENTLGELFPYNNESETTGEDEDNIDLMATSESGESDDNFTSEDIAFLGDDEDLEEDPTFYRAIENQV